MVHWTTGRRIVLRTPTPLPTTEVPAVDTLVDEAVGEAKMLEEAVEAKAVAVDAAEAEATVKYKPLPLNQSIGGLSPQHQVLHRP